MSADHASCVCGILVGGRSVRMGRPKAALPLPGGGTLVEHVFSVAARAGPWIDESVLLGECGALPVGLAGVRRLPDGDPGAGPLAGLRSLLDYARSRWGLLLACDMPLLRPRLLERLWGAATPQCDAVAFRQTGRREAWHACCALYHPRVLPAVVRELEGGRRSLQNLLSAVRVVTLDAASEEKDMLTNLNTPRSYESLFQRS